MNKSQRIFFNDINDNNAAIKILLEQNIEKIEFLSLELSTVNVYQNQNSDYGVLIGRVIANDGVGVPNAKISIFIPINDTDINNDNIYSIYPYKTPRDKNNEGKRYNLLPRVSCINPENDIIKPKQPFGSFPLKEEIITNDVLMTVYKKYYKYSTVTNSSGDYMIFGAPIGIQTVHMSVDITDIGDYSMTPGSMITDLGYSSNLFTSDKTEIKYSNDLTDLPNIETQEISVNIIPFWGNTDIFEIGITRQDFRIRSTIKPSFIVFGSAFTDGENGIWGGRGGSGSKIGELYNINFSSITSRDDSLLINNKRNIEINEKIYYYINDVSDVDINSGVDPQNNIRLLDKSEYTSYYKNGDFVFVIPCNRRKKITDEYGNTVDVDSYSNNGVFTEFRGFIVIEPKDSSILKSCISDSVFIETFRFKLKFPQHMNKTERLTPENIGYDTNNSLGYNNKWRRQSCIFCYGKYYTLSKYHSIVGNSDFWSDNSQEGGSYGFFNHSCVLDFNRNENDIGTINTTYTYNIDKFPSNYLYPSSCSIYDYDTPAFGLNWMNIGIYFPQISKVTTDQCKINYVYASDFFTEQKVNGDDNSEYNSYFTSDNNQKFVNNELNTCGFARPDIHWTDIVEVPVVDIKTMLCINSKGFCKNSTINSNLIGNYRNGKYIPSSQFMDTTNQWDNCSTPWNIKYYNNIVVTPNGNSYDYTVGNGNISTSYFYKGQGNSDVIKFLVDLKLI